MARVAFKKILSANDVGSTGAHQAGILIPKGESALLEFLPRLDPSIKNPDTWLQCIDDDQEPQRFRFVYYNNKLHEPRGTRNEYRLTWMTAWFKNLSAQAGDTFEISGEPGRYEYWIRVIPAADKQQADDMPARIQLRGWQRVY